MKTRRPAFVILTLVMVLALALPALAAYPDSSERGIAPSTYAGNFVASDDVQVCYELANLGYIGDVTTDMVGVKVDPPIGYSDGYVSTTISADGKFLDWESENATVHAFVIKGGPNYNVFDYVGTNFDWDKGLFSPPQGSGKKATLPQISHYNFCYTPDFGDDQGCTPGYWRNHADRWEGVAPGDDFDTTFGVDLFDPNITLGTAIWLGGGGNNAFARHATAALLNAYGGVPNGDGTTVAYPYTVAEVIQMVQDAVANDTIEATKDLFEAANELGCPLSGTSADPVVP
jgi:hypothetical protein